jgi:hypothetical protein
MRWIATVIMEAIIEKSLGCYQILEQTGSGGVATVYKAKDSISRIIWQSK